MRRDPGSSPAPGGARIGTELLRCHPPLYDAVIEEIDGRMIRIGDRWLADFASCNYLGLDLEPEVIDAAYLATQRWGTHPSWSRLLGSPRLYREIEEQLTELLGSADSLVFPTITHIHQSVIPVLAGGGQILVDGRAHRTLYDGCRVATLHGATVRRYPADDLDALAALLAATPPGPNRLICTDGVNSMTGNLPDLAALIELADRYDATVYVDDAHGFGVIGERSADETCPYGSRGNSIVRHLGLDYDRVVLVGGFSKAYSALLAFLALSPDMKDRLKVEAAPYLYSGPSPISSLAGVLAGFELNRQRGDALRARLHALTGRVLGVLDDLQVHHANRTGLPIIEIPLMDADQLPAVGRLLFEHGVYVTLAAYPLVPRHEVGFRIQLTAANTDEQIDLLAEALSELTDRDALQPAA